MINTKIAGKYVVKKKIGSGMFSEVFLVRSNTGEDFALKAEKNSTRNPQLIYESKLLKLFQNIPGIPSVSWVGAQDDYSILVLELLGPTLEDLFSFCNHKFCLKTILMLSDQILSRLELIHTKSYVHRDLKPDNFLLGLSKRSSLLYLIDFGLAKRYRNPKTHEHVVYKEGKKLSLNLKFSSINTHSGIEYTRRDDLISVAYLLIYLLRGELPWQTLKYKGKQSEELIKDKKISVNVDELVADHPAEFKTFLAYCLNLKFDEEPDYTYLRRMFKGLYISSGFEDDAIFDWSLMNYVGCKKRKSFDEEKKVKELECKGKGKNEEEKKKKKTCLVI